MEDALPTLSLRINTHPLLVLPPLSAPHLRSSTLPPGSSVAPVHLSQVFPQISPLQGGNHDHPISFPSSPLFLYFSQVQ